jgi:FtsH-binding integral membrane protein
MKMFLWIALGVLVSGLALWIVTTNSNLPSQPLFFPVIALVFVLPPFGSFWMLYMAIRYEKRPLLYALLAFVPYVFLGYYFDRVRRKKLERNAHSHPR